MPKEQGDGHEWSVSETGKHDRVKQRRIRSQYNAQVEAAYSELRTWFADENVFLEVIDSLLELDHGKSLRVRKRAKHKAKGYLMRMGSCGDRRWIG